MRKLTLFTCWAVLALWVLPTRAPATEFSADQYAFFEKQVRPVLADHCYECHAGEEPEGELRVDSLAGLLQGGSRGPAIVPGRAADSLLIRALRHDELLQMPPSEKLAARMIADLERWIEIGAPWPDAEPVAPAAAQGELEPPLAEQDRAFWAFQPPQRPELPEVRDPTWIRTPIDAFILHELEQRDLQPAPAADKRTLIRRVTFDLTGLPPTPAEVERFLADDSPEAYPRLVDRLLDSPHYGERWGRHWLDVARYADSNGMDENMAYANAYRYRDYVIEAFNRDLPFDQFVQEQIAGDLMPVESGAPASERHRRLIATGFLAIGPKMLADDDPVKKEMDIIDEQLSTLSGAFLGLTIGCARCHDHKFDPISAADYYRLAGIFKSTKTMENFGVVAEWHEHTIATQAERQALAEHEERIAQVQAAIAAAERRAQHELLDRTRRRAGYYLIAAHYLNQAGPPRANGRYAIGEYLDREQLPDGYLVLEAEQFARGTLEVDTTNWGKDVGVLLQSGYAEYDITVPASGSYQLELRYAAEQSRPVRLVINGELVKADAAREVTGGWYAAQQRWALEGTFSLRAGANMLRIERDGVVPHIDKILLAPVDADAPTTLDVATLTGRLGLQPEVLRPWQEWLANQTSLDALPEIKDFRDFASLGPDEQLARMREQSEQLQVRFDEAIESFPTASSGEAGRPEQVAIRRILYGPDSPVRLPEAAEQFYSPAAKAELEQLKTEKQQLEKNRPQPSRAIGVTEGSVQNVAIHLRGSHLTLGSEVARGVPRIIAGESPMAISSKESGRLQLAQWLTRPDHPLTSRVMANRIWRWHFGRGLVRTVDNFGRLGEPPTHPALLDWLACELVEQGWSLKQLHRQILLSSTYQMSTAYDERSAEVDPENRWYWRFERRRLEAEDIRDALLALGGQLDRTMGGQLMTYNNRDYVAGLGSNLNHYDSKRRSVYLPVFRSAVYEFLQAFDFADPSVLNGDREATTVAPQALFMMNSELVAESAAGLAASLLSEGVSDVERVELAYLRIYGRPVESAELERCLAFVSSATSKFGETESEADARRLAWRSLCRVLLAGNEFVYLE